MKSNFNDHFYQGVQAYEKLALAQKEIQADKAVEAVESIFEYWNYIGIVFESSQALISELIRFYELEPDVVENSEEIKLVNIDVIMELSKISNVLCTLDSSLVSLYWILADVK